MSSQNHPHSTKAPVTTKNPPTRRLHELDLLRFLAALAVLLYHYTGTTGGPWHDQNARELFAPTSLATQFGYLGVELFFLISGFVILMSAWGRTMADFTISRITRLYPAYWFAVLLIAAIYLTTGHGRGRPENIIPNLTMFQQGMGIQNASGVFWTLWTEMHFYAFISILVLTGVTYQRCITFMATWTVLAIFAQETGAQPLQSLLIPQHAPYFIAGMALYLIHRFGPTLLLWGFTAFSWATSIRYALPTATEHPYNIAPSNAWPAIPIAITLIYLTMSLAATGKLRHLKWRGFATLGCLTYPTYLIHYELAPPLADALHPALPYWAATTTIIAIVLTTAYLIHRLIERPLAAWLKPRLRDSFQRIRTTSPNGPRQETPHNSPPASETTAKDNTPTPHDQEPHSSTPSAPIGSTI
ncbi:acyltransferase [Actinomadura viridis]|uniref:Peptidoglycan/LPS O-acetylase OafA/YrhL n=1 Tax=Actinomadura viridis TaxID=58110 RepID=A0A931DK17_9ACTN|nr:acyltransferase [Actinomadura viridis]MBG6090013.1 peptidoglycan/LPS O-acetylase OafA/YrhL [Actinomadura viridis]